MYKITSNRVKKHKKPLKTHQNKNKTTKVQINYHKNNHQTKNKRNKKKASHYPHKTQKQS